MDTIFENAGHTSHKPSVKWDFEVSFIQEYPIIDGISDDNKNDFNNFTNLCLQLPKYCYKASYDSVTINKHDTFFPGFKYSYPGLPKINGTLKLSFYDDDFNARKQLMYLMELHSTMDYGKNVDLTRYNKYQPAVNNHYKYFDINIKIYHDKEVYGNLIFKHCFVNRISGIALDYESNEPLDVEADFQYVYYKFTDLLDNETSDERKV